MGRFFSLAAAAFAVAVLPLHADAQTRDVSGKVTQAVVGTPIAEAIAEGEDIEPTSRESEEPDGLQDEDGEDHYTASPGD